MIDEELLDSEARLLGGDHQRLLWHLATSGAQVRRAAELAGEFGVERLAGERPRAVLIASDAPPSSVQVLSRLAGDTAPVVAWHGVELPSWAGASDALLVGAVDGRHPRLAEVTDQGARRGLSMAVVAPAGSPVAAAAGRAPVHALRSDLNPRAARWAVLAPLLQALDALALSSVPPGLLEGIADALDVTAEQCRPGGEVFTNAAKALAVEFAETRPVVIGAGALAGVAAHAIAEAVQLGAGVPAVAVSLPDGVGRAGALLRGSASRPDPDDLFRDRVDDFSPQRARLLVVGTDGDARDPALGERSGAHVQLDEVAARRAASALTRLAESFGVRWSDVDVPAGAPLARFAAATLFGEFTAAYLGFGLGLDPGARRPAELEH